MRTRVGVLCPSKRPHTVGSEVKSCQSCLIHNLKTTEANLMKLDRKIKHNEKVCLAQKLGSCAHGRAKGQIMSLKSCLIHSLKTTEANLKELHRKMKHNGSHTKGQGHSRVKHQSYLKSSLSHNLKTTEARVKS